MAYEFDGTSEYIQFSLPSGFTPAAGQHWTLSVITEWQTASDFVACVAIVDPATAEYVGAGRNNSTGVYKILSNGKTPGSGGTWGANTERVLTLTWDGTQLELFADGSSDYSVTPSSAITWANLDAVRVAQRGDGFYQLDGFAAEVALWDAQLSDSEIAQLGARVSPLSVSPGNLILYAPLIRDRRDVVAGDLGTENGAPVVSEHPRIIRPSMHLVSSAAAPAATNDITATAALTFGSAADLDATGTVAATAALAFTSAADLDATGTVAATAALAFGTTATPDAIGSVTATSAAAFGSTATLNAPGVITATAALAFGTTANLTEATANDITATAALAFGTTATLNATGTATATAALTFGTTATLADAASSDVAATMAMAFGTTATLNATGTVTATAALTFGTTATLSVPNDLVATAAMAFGTTATLNATGTLTATSAVLFGTTANLVDANAIVVAHSGRTFTPVEEVRTCVTGASGRTFTPGV